MQEISPLWCRKGPLQLSVTRHPPSQVSALTPVPLDPPFSREPSFHSLLFQTCGSSSKASFLGFLQQAANRESAVSWEAASICYHSSRGTATSHLMMMTSSSCTSKLRPQVIIKGCYESPSPTTETPPPASLRPGPVGDSTSEAASLPKSRIAVKNSALPLYF